MTVLPTGLLIYTFKTETYQYRKECTLGNQTGNNI